ncbi:MAG: hypothetical protein KGQ75_13930 [Sphingomonadales bacterium]|nr:hypothetical protein [Sphingomonadales bacterium]
MSEPTPTATPSPANDPPATPVWPWVVWLFAAIGLLAAIAILWLVAVIAGWRSDQRQQAVVAKAGEERLFKVDDVSPLVGTNVVVIRIGLLDGGGKISSGYGRELRNVILLDPKTGASRRLLPDNTREISDLRFLPGEDDTEQLPYAARERREDEDKSAPSPRYIVFQLTQPDHRDKGSMLMVGPVTAGNPVPVLEGIDRIDHFDMVDDDHASLIARKSGQLHFFLLDLEARKITEDHTIDIG